MFIYQMPYDVRRKLVDALNGGEFWKELGGRRLNYSYEDLSKFGTAIYRPGDSPADALLTHWGQKNHTVTELFKHLLAVRHFQALDAIKSCVPDKYHKYITATSVVAAVGGAESTIISATSAPVIASRRPPNPPKEYRHALRDKAVAENFDQPSSVSSSAFAVDKCAAKLRELQKLDSSASGGSAMAGTAAAAAAAAAASTLDLEKTSNAAAAAAAAASQTSRLKQQTPNKIPIPNPELMLRNVAFEELRVACNDFSGSNLLGRGGFGEVYLGRWNGQSVAVKRIREERRRALIEGNDQKYVNQAITELQALHNYPAENVLPLMAFSFTDDMETDPCLVYLYMPKGSVADQLRNRRENPPLDWNRRANVALGTARGLCHLHANNIIHGDIKSANILLDRHFEAKIGDFGLARGGPESDAFSYKLVSTVQGTAAYLPHDYVRSRHLTPAVDTFCYGIMLFELVTGKSPAWVDPASNTTMREIMLNASHPEPWVDPTAGLPDRDNDAAAATDWPKCLFFLGRDCTKSRRKSRPDMRIVLAAMEELHRCPQTHQIEMGYANAVVAGRTHPKTSDDVPVIPTILNSDVASVPLDSESYAIISESGPDPVTRNDEDDDDDDDDTTSVECNESAEASGTSSSYVIPNIIMEASARGDSILGDPELSESLPMLVEHLKMQSGKVARKESVRRSSLDIPELPDLSYYLGVSQGGEDDFHGFGRFMAAEAAASDASALDLLSPTPVKAD